MLTIGIVVLQVFCELRFLLSALNFVQVTMCLNYFAESLVRYVNLGRLRFARPVIDRIRTGNNLVGNVSRGLFRFTP